MKMKETKKTIKDFDKIFNEELQKNLNSEYEHTRKNAIKLTLHYCYGYFETNNSQITKVLKVLINSYKNNSRNL